MLDITSRNRLSRVSKFSNGTASPAKSNLSGNSGTTTGAIRTVSGVRNVPAHEGVCAHPVTVKIKNRKEMQYFIVLKYQTRKDTKIPHIYFMRRFVSAGTGQIGTQRSVYSEI